MFKIRALFPITIWLRNRNVSAMRNWSYGRRNIEVLDMVLALAIYSFFIYLAEIAVHNVIFSFTSRPLELWVAYSSIYHSASPSSSPHMFYRKHGERMTYPNPLLWLQHNCDMSSKSQWFWLTVRKNRITTDIFGGAHGVMEMDTATQVQIPTRQNTFHIALIPLGKIWIQLFSLQLWINSTAD